MKLLIDENLPKRLKNDLKEHDPYTVRDMGWQGTKNGELLQLMLQEGFDALLTFDKNLKYQQNFDKYPISVFIFNTKDNTYPCIKSVVSKLLTLIKSNVSKGGIEIR